MNYKKDIYNTYKKCECVYVLGGGGEHFRQEGAFLPSPSLSPSHMYINIYILICTFLICLLGTIVFLSTSTNKKINL